LISLFSPFLGLIFVVSYCGKIWHWEFRKQILVAALYFAVIIIVVAYDGALAVSLNASDALVGIGLGAVLFVLIVKNRLDINKALALLVVYETAYCFFRSWLFAPTLLALSKEMTPVYEAYMHRIPALQKNKEMLQWIQNFMISYQSAIWGSIQLTGVFIGFLLFNRISVLKLQIRYVRFPDRLVYLMIIALALSIYSHTRLFGINLLICSSVIYLMQGVAVLSFAWGNYFTKTKLLRTLLIIAIILNYPILILISFIGVLDVWFDFRKLNSIMEEKNESDIN